MSRTTIVTSIDAPIDRVFDTVAHIENFSKAVPHITDVEFLTEQHQGEGTRFRETRLMRGREASTTLEVSEYVENERTRMVADEGGTIWDTTFTVASTNGGGTDLTMVMEATAYKTLAKVVNPLMKGIIAKAVKADMDAIKVYCEGEDEGAGSDG